MRLLLPIVMLPLVEIALFVVIGGRIGVLATLALVVGSAVLGVWLIRNGGRQTLEVVARTMAARGDPSPVLADGALVVLAGWLLLLPGFLTGLAGLVLLLPPVRAALRRAVARRTGGRRPPGAARGDVIETTWHEIDHEPRHPPSPGRD